MMMIILSTATTSILLFSNQDRHRIIIMSVLLTNISDKSNVVLKSIKPEPIITARILFFVTTFKSCQNFQFRVTTPTLFATNLNQLAHKSRWEESTSGSFLICGKLGWEAPRTIPGIGRTRRRRPSPTRNWEHLQDKGALSKVSICYPKTYFLTGHMECNRHSPHQSWFLHQFWTNTNICLFFARGWLIHVIPIICLQKMTYMSNILDCPLRNPDDTKNHFLVDKSFMTIHNWNVTMSIL